MKKQRELVTSLGHLPHTYDVGLSVPRVELVKNTGVGTLLTALRRSGLARKVPTDIAAKLREMLEPSMRRKVGSEGCDGRWQPLSSRDLVNPPTREERIERIRGERGLGHSREQLRIRSCHEWTGAAVAESPTLPARPRREEKSRTSRRWLVL